jgi:hypothetical protein
MSAASFSHVVGLPRTNIYFRARERSWQCMIAIAAQKPPMLP